MFLSRLTLNPRSRQVRRELAEPYQMHRTLMRAFFDGTNDDPGRILFRVDLPRDPGPPALLVQSQVQPNWSLLHVGEDYLLRDPETKEFDPEFRPGQRLCFRLRANPTVKREGKRHGLFREEEQIAWLRRKAQAGGFEVCSVQVVPEGNQRGRKTDENGGHDLTFFSVLFDGVIEVLTPEKMRATLAFGIGSAKGLGFGLLSLAKA